MTVSRFYGQLNEAIVANRQMWFCASTGVNGRSHEHIYAVHDIEANGHTHLGHGTITVGFSTEYGAARQTYDELPFRVEVTEGLLANGRVMALPGEGVRQSLIEQFSHHCRMHLTLFSDHDGAGEWHHRIDWRVADAFTIGLNMTCAGGPDEIDKAVHAAAHALASATPWMRPGSAFSMWQRRIGNLFNGCEANDPPTNFLASPGNAVVTLMPGVVIPGVRWDRSFPDMKFTLTRSSVNPGAQMRLRPTRKLEV